MYVCARWYCHLLTFLQKCGENFLFGRLLNEVPVFGTSVDEANGYHSPLGARIPLAENTKADQTPSWAYLSWAQSKESKESLWSLCPLRLYFSAQSASKKFVLIRVHSWLTLLRNQRPKNLSASGGFLWRHTIYSLPWAKSKGITQYEINPCLKSLRSLRKESIGLRPQR